MSMLYNKDTDFINLKISRGGLRLIRHLLYKYRNDSDLKTRHLVELLELNREIETCQRGYGKIDFPINNGVVKLMNFHMKYLKK